MSDYNELLSRAKEQIRASELAPHAAQIEALLRPGIAINTEAAPDDEIEIGSSKIGGLPDAPRDFAWPFFRDEPLSFIAQFRLEEIAPFDLESVLPASGLLSFFSAIWPCGDVEDSTMHGDIGVISQTRGAWRVLYFDGAQNFERAALPNRDLGRIYNPHAISRLWNDVSVPDSSAIELESLFREKNGAPTNAYFELWKKLGDDQPRDHSLLGQGYFYQDDERMTAEKFARGFAYDAEMGAEWDAIRENAARWRLLLQLGDVDDMSWAGDGYGYFYLPEKDLAARHFENAYFGLQR